MSTRPPEAQPAPAPLLRVPQTSPRPAPFTPHDVPWPDLAPVARDPAPRQSVSSTAYRERSIP